MIEWNGFLYHPAKRIINGLWIGSERDAADPDFLRKHDIRLIVNATDSVPQYYDIRTLRVPVDDARDSARRMTKYLPISSIAIDDVLRHGQNVLVHCRAGMNRSATVVAGYLMYSRGLTAAQAMFFIKRIKPECFTPMNFLESLNAWETKLRSNGKIRSNRTAQTGPIPRTARQGSRSR